MNKPNILLVMTDQHRASALGFAGKEKVITPHWDAFAAQSTNFRKAVVNTPACSPARACLMTGLHTLSHGLVTNDMPLRTDVKTLPHCLNDIGYQSSFIGKWHMDHADRGVFIPPGPRRQGFDDFWAGHNCNHSYYESYYYLNDDPEPVWIEGYEAFEQTRLAEDFLRAKAQSEPPFFLFLSYGPPHCPYAEVDQKYKDLYPEDEIELLPNAAPHARKDIIANYYAHITAMDECFGRLMAALEETGQADNTLVVFTSDHGDMLFSQDRGWKGKPWAESVNIPMLIRWPGHVPAGAESDGLISLADLMPTLVSLAGGEIPEGTEGLDLSALLLGDESVSPESAFINFNVLSTTSSITEWRGIVTRAYTYARFRERPWVLYHDAQDPYQLNNLAENPAYTELQSDMEAKLQAWLNRLGDPFDTSAGVMAKYYDGELRRGIPPFYDNDLIKNGKAERRARRLAAGGTV
jgi:arylsulfatase A-like enzyme